MINGPVRPSLPARPPGRSHTWRAFVTSHATSSFQSCGTYLPVPSVLLVAVYKGQLGIPGLQRLACVSLVTRSSGWPISQYPFCHLPPCIIPKLYKVKKRHKLPPLGQACQACVLLEKTKECGGLARVTPQAPAGFFQHEVRYDKIRMDGVTLARPPHSLVFSNRTHAWQAWPRGGN